MLNINKFKCYALSHNWKIVFMLTLAMRSEVITTTTSFISKRFYDFLGSLKLKF